MRFKAFLALALFGCSGSESSPVQSRPVAFPVNSDPGSATPPTRNLNQFDVARLISENAKISIDWKKIAQEAEKRFLLDRCDIEESYQEFNTQKPNEAPAHEPTLPSPGSFVRAKPAIPKSVKSWYRVENKPGLWAYGRLEYVDGKPMIKSIEMFMLKPW